MSYVLPYFDQKYLEIKEKCLIEGSLFVDEYFSKDNHNIFAIFNKKEFKKFKFKRPMEIFENPKFFFDDAEPNDVNQGKFINLNFKK